MRLMDDKFIALETAHIWLNGESEHAGITSAKKKYFENIWLKL